MNIIVCIRCCLLILTTVRHAQQLILWLSINNGQIIIIAKNAVERVQAGDVFI